jgi:D-cysteine desulfhydrase
MIRPFKVLGIQQIAIGGPDKTRLQRLWVDMFGLEVTGTFRSERENVDEDICAIGTGPFKVEVDLMQPLDLDKKPAVHTTPLNHVGLWIDDLSAAVDWLGAKGVRFAPGGIRKGAAGFDICFVHPKGSDELPIGGEGVLIELVQAPPEVVRALMPRWRHNNAMDLSRFPRRRYTPFATPLEFLPNFTRALAASCPGGQGPDIWIKRDDMLGLFPGGNKTRKLEFLVADALAQGADTLVTCGAPQSNHCRITLAAAVKEGLKCRFVIEERVPNSYDVNASGNNFMFRLMGVEAITVVPGGSNMAEAMQKMAGEVAALGRKAYIIPGGGSNALGGLGYVACAQELQQQLFEQGLQIDRVVVGSGSSGTHGGLVAGFLGNHINIPIVGIGVSRDPSDQQPLVLREAQAVADLLKLNLTVQAEDVTCVGGYWQPKYSIPNAAMVEAVQMLARTEGIPLDPVYTGKIMAGLIGLARQGYFKPGEKLLFLHTGGLPSLHAYESTVLGE